METKPVFMAILIVLKGPEFGTDYKAINTDTNGIKASYVNNVKHSPTHSRTVTKNGGPLITSFAWQEGHRSPWISFH